MRKQRLRAMNEVPYSKAHLYRRIVQSKRFIDEHYAETIDVDCISDQAYFSKFHFIRLFKRIYGRTPHQYLTRVRIERAKQLLEQGESITQVCFAVGFDSVGSFSTLFKKMVRMTPLDFQLRKRKLQADVSSAPFRFIPGCFARNDPTSQKSNSQEATK